jgi:16S rRNA (uracil1498-N3)-methyltransferase
MKKKEVRKRYGTSSREGVLHRFFVLPEKIRDKEVVLTEQAHQIRDVLRLKVGERIIVLDNEGWEYEAELIDVRKDKARGQVVEKREVTGEPEVRITLYQSLLAREKFEWVLQKCTEIGVAGFVPVVTERSVVRDGGIKASRLGRWRRIIQEAAEQSHRGRLPEMAGAVRFKDVLRELNGFGISLIASPGAKEKSLRDCLKGRLARPELLLYLSGLRGALLRMRSGRLVGAGPLRLVWVSGYYGQRRRQ